MKAVWASCSATLELGGRRRGGRWPHLTVAAGDLLFADSLAILQALLLRVTVPYENRDEHHQRSCRETRSRFSSRVGSGVDEYACGTGHNPPSVL